MTVAPQGPRADGRPPRLAFSNLTAGATTPLFTLPIGLMEINLHAVDPNNPGVLTLQDSTGNTILTLNTSVGDVPVFTGSLFYEVPALGQTMKINVTQAAQCVEVYFGEVGT